MKITIKQDVDVSITPYCKNCYRKEIDNTGQTFCMIFNKYLSMNKGQYLKCRECYNALYDELNK